MTRNPAPLSILAFILKDTSWPEVAAWTRHFEPHFILKRLLEIP